MEVKLKQPNDFFLGTLTLEEETPTRHVLQWKGNNMIDGMSSFLISGLILSIPRFYHVH
jgi:hypothetical protein